MYTGIDNSELQEIRMSDLKIEEIKSREYRKYRPWWIVLTILCIIGIIVVLSYALSHDIDFLFPAAYLLSIVLYFIVFGIIISLISTLKVSQAIQIRIYCELNNLNTRVLHNGNETMHVASAADANANLNSNAATEENANHTKTT